MYLLENTSLLWRPLGYAHSRPLGYAHSRPLGYAHSRQGSSKGSWWMFQGAG